MKQLLQAKFGHLVRHLKSQRPSCGDLQQRESNTVAPKLLRHPSGSRSHVRSPRAQDRRRRRGPSHTIACNPPCTTTPGLRDLRGRARARSAYRSSRMMRRWRCGVAAATSSRENRRLWAVGEDLQGLLPWAARRGRHVEGPASGCRGGVGAQNACAYPAQGATGARDRGNSLEEQRGSGTWTEET